MSKSKQKTSLSRPGLNKIVNIFSSLWQKRHIRMLLLLFFALLLSSVGYQIYLSKQRMPSRGNEIVFRYESLSGSKIVKQSDGTLVGAIKPNDVLITGNGNLYCNIAEDGKLRTKALGTGEVKKLYDQLYLKNRAVRALAATQHAKLPDFTDVMDPAVLVINDRAGASYIYNSNDPNGVFGTTVDTLQNLCKQNPPTLTVKRLPSLKDPVLKKTNNTAVSYLQVFGLLGDASASPTFDGADETSDYNDINSHRASHVGKGPLYRSGCLTTVARQWAYHMAAANSLAHNSNLSSQVDSTCGTNWTALGENVGESGDEGSLFQAFLNSPCHHSNIDDTSINYSSSLESCSWSSSGYNMVGVGAYRDDNNILWVTQNYATCYSCTSGKWKTAPTNVYSSATSPTTTSSVSSGSGHVPSWHDLGGLFMSGPGVTSMNSGHEEVFAVGTNKVLYHKYWRSGVGWSKWYPFSGSCGTSDSPSATSWGNGRMDVYFRTCSGAIGHYAFQSGAWSYGTMGASYYGGPAVASEGPGTLDLFIRWTTGNQLLENMYRNGAWSGWQGRGGSLTSSPAATSWGAGRVDVVARGSNNNVYHTTNANGWAWDYLGGVIQGSPGISSRASGSLDVFVRGTNNALYQKSYSGGSWTGFIYHGGQLTSSPASVSRSSSYVNVYARQSDKSTAFAAWVQGKSWL